MLSFLQDYNQHVVIVFSVSATLFIVAALLGLVYANGRKKSILNNWYDNNLLEMSRSGGDSGNVNVFKCHKVSRLDTFDEGYIENEEVLGRHNELNKIKAPIVVSPPSSSQRKMSKIRNVSLLKEPSSSTNYRHSIGGTDNKDVSSLFTVPKSIKPSSSMFQNLSQSQIDRGLYNVTSMGESEYYDDQNSTVGTFGSLKMALHFDTSLNILTVVLKQAVDLSSKRNSDELPNPYFKISLELPEPNETKSKMQHQSKVYHKTNSPLIDQEFFFQVPSDCDINSCRLEILISDFDKFSVDEDIGYCWLTLGRVNISEFKDKPTTFWAEVLTVKEVGSEFGEVLLSFTYLPKAQRLTVNVFKGRNLPISESESQTNLSVRISLVQISTNKKIKKKKTASKKSSCNHVQFNEPLNFNISNGLCDSLLEIELINEMGPFKMHQQVLAKLNLPLYKCKDLWKNIIHEDQIKGVRWYTLGSPHNNV